MTIRWATRRAVGVTLVAGIVVASVLVGNQYLPPRTAWRQASEQIETCACGEGQVLLLGVAVAVVVLVATGSAVYHAVTTRLEWRKE